MTEAREFVVVGWWGGSMVAVRPDGAPVPFEWGQPGHYATVADALAVAKRHGATVPYTRHGRLAYAGIVN